MNTKSETQKLVRALGGPRPLARRLGIKHNPIMGWKRVPAVRVKALVAIAEELGYLHDGEPLTAAMIRPDVF